MCGIYGMIAERGTLRHPELLDAMGASLRHRGPDGHADFREPDAAIGTERLRVMDLHERADQPFASPNGEVWLECNGEIYNATELRARFRDYPFVSHSDIECILPLYLEQGPTAIQLLDGMFALAIWDNRTKTLILARDRAGEKPLFYARINGEIVFGSELQSILRHPDLARDVDDIAIAEYLRLGYIPEARSPFHAIRRVPAGTFIRFTAGREEMVRYWDPGSFAIEPIDEQVAVETIQELIEKAVAKQMMADVPVGVFISGGMDSLILATLASQVIGVDKVHTFSAQFAEESYDESGDAAALARQLHTTHVTVRADETTLREALAAVTCGMAEPLADAAILPTFLLSRTAREHVKVVLSGEGADELFGGYPTYLGHKIAPYYDALPSFLRTGLRRAAQQVQPSMKKMPLEFLLKRFVTHAELPWVERHLAWFGTGLTSAVYLNGAPSFPNLRVDAGGGDALVGAMSLDYRSYLRDNLLVKVDRATMLSSIEARAPYLDRDVSKFALSLPGEMRVRRFTTKWLLKKAAEKWIPRDVIYRRKQGLSVPTATWINGGLRSEVDRLLTAERLLSHGINASYVTRLLDEHRASRANHSKALWAIIMLEYWFECWAQK